MIHCVWFAPNMALCMMTKHLHVGPEDIVPEMLWFVRMSFGENMLFPSYTSIKAIVVQTFSYSVMNTSISCLYRDHMM